MPPTIMMRSAGFDDVERDYGVPVIQMSAKKRGVFQIQRKVSSSEAEQHAKQGKALSVCRGEVSIITCDNDTSEKYSFDSMVLLKLDKIMQFNDVKHFNCGTMDGGSHLMLKVLQKEIKQLLREWQKNVRCAQVDKVIGCIFKFKGRLPMPFYTKGIVYE
jgi:hypothetical protein